MGDKKFIYKVSWKQEYEQWEKEMQAVDAILDILMELLNYADAKEVIERVKKL